MAATKNAINATWHLLLRKKEVPSSAKYKVYEAVLRSIMCYGAQVWGYQEYEEVEKLQRFFIKKVFQLPQNTPNYMINLETGLSSIYMHTLKLHFDYIVKAISLSNNRLPHILGTYAIRRKLNFAQKWRQLAEECDLRTDFEWENHVTLKEQLYTMLRETDTARRNGYIQKAINSENRIIYPNLDYNLEDHNYFNDSNSCRKISLLFRARGELLNLNGTPFSNVENKHCTLCNLCAKEDTYHFIGICPIMRQWRLEYFNKATLTLEEVIVILNGQNWEMLYGYCEAALRYRGLILSEFL